MADADGSVYVADSGNHVIRRISPEGNVTTVAGQPGVRGSDDGPAMQAHLDTPAGIDVDAAGNLYIPAPPPPSGETPLGQPARRRRSKAREQFVAAKAAA